MASAEKFFEKMKEKKVAFIGLGVSHTDLVRLFAQKGIKTEVRDKADREKLGAIAGELESLGVTLKLGETYLDNVDADVVFRTPGMNWWNPALCSLREKGRAVTSEMEVFSTSAPAKNMPSPALTAKPPQRLSLPNFCPPPEKPSIRAAISAGPFCPLLKK